MWFFLKIMSSLSYLFMINIFNGLPTNSEINPASAKFHTHRDEILRRLTQKVTP